MAFGRFPEVDDVGTSTGLTAAVLFFLAATRDERRVTVETDLFGGIADSLSTDAIVSSKRQNNVSRTGPQMLRYSPFKWFFP